VKFLNILGIVSIAMLFSLVLVQCSLSQTTPQNTYQEPLINTTNLSNLPVNETEEDSRFALLLDCPVNMTKLPDDCYVFPLSKNNQ
jgi:hypothetical protein